MPFETTVNWLVNDIWRYLVIGCFDWKIDVFQQTNVRVYYILKVILRFRQILKYFNAFVMVVILLFFIFFKGTVEYIYIKNGVLNTFIGHILTVPFRRNNNWRQIYKRNLNFNSWKILSKNYKLIRICYGLFTELPTIIVGSDLNSKELFHLSWQNKYSNLKNNCYMKSKLFLWANFLEI